MRCAVDEDVKKKRKKEKKQKNFNKKSTEIKGGKNTTTPAIKLARAKTQ